jgi:uncharacterized oxidoreductase
MKITDNTILITGGGSGIGRGLAEAFHALGNKVIIAGRRKHALAETTAANPGMISVLLDLDEPEAIRTFAERLIAEHPTLNVLINNAGITRREDLKSPQPNSLDSDAVITTNFLGPIRLGAVLLPHLQKQTHSAIMNVTSGLGFLPLALAPTYSATKAGLHSYTQSLRYQLNGTSVQVLELIPPYVQTELGGAHQANDPAAMPLRDFISETMAILKNSPEETEICVDRAKMLRFAERSGKFDAIFTPFNDAFSGPTPTHALKEAGLI